MQLNIPKVDLFMLRLKNKKKGYFGLKCKTAEKVCQKNTKEISSVIVWYNIVKESEISVRKLAQDLVWIFQGK